MTNPNLPFAPASTATDSDFNRLWAPFEKFAGIMFERVDLYGAHLMLAEFTNCRFTDVIFTKAVMNRIRIINCPIDGSAISDNDEIGVIWLP